MYVTTLKNTERMVLNKLAWLIFDVFGIPTVLLGILNNLDNVKSVILIILGSIYLMIRTYFYFIQKNQAVRKEEIELWHKEQDKQERIDKNKK